MSSISDKSRSVFSDAEKTVLSNFTTEETKQIDDLAEKLRGIIEAAKRRDPAAANPRY
jgi:hypothetical protein